jgi:hypothetical protein
MGRRGHVVGITLAMSLAGVGVLGGLTAAGAGAAAPGLAGGAAAPPCGGSAGKYYKAVVKAHPVAYYRLDEVGGPTACDDSGNSNSGTYASSGITYGVAGALTSSTDPAVSANGTVDPVTASPTDLPTGNTNFTMEGWFATTSTNDQMLVDIGQESKDAVAGLGIWNSGSTLMIDLYTDSVSFPIPSGTNVLDGKYHFIAVTYSAASEKFTGYLDGKKLGKTIHAGPLALGGGTLRIGWWVDTVYNQPFNGSMDEIAVFPSALSKTTIKAQYAAAA